MRVRLSLLPLTAALCLGLLSAARAGAQLADSSPFLPASGPGSAGAAAENEPLELRGMMATSEGLRVCIYDAAKKSSRWVGLNDTSGGNRFVVKSADPERDTASIMSDGRVMTLALQKGKVASLAPSSGVTVVSGWRESAVVLNPTAADEQRRLQAIAAEVRRRRLQREAADRMTGPPGGDNRQQR